MTNEEARNILSQYDTSPIIEMYWTDGEQIPSDNVYEALDMAIKALETPPNDNWEGYSKRLWKAAYERGKADAEQTRWIPLNADGYEPKKNGKYQVTLDGGSVTDLHYEDGEWLITGYQVIAWMLLPEPYKAESEEV